MKIQQTNSKQPKHPSTVGCINEVWYLYYNEFPCSSGFQNMMLEGPGTFLGGPLDQKYFYNNTDTLFTCFTELTFAFLLQK